MGNPLGSIEKTQNSLHKSYLKFKDVFLLIYIFAYIVTFKSDFELYPWGFSAGKIWMYCTGSQIEN